VRRHLVAAGAGAVAPVKEFLAEQEGGSSWGLRVLAELLPDAEVRATAVALLAEAGRRYTRDPEKKLTLLAWLTEHHGAAAEGATDAAAEAAILPLLEDFADDVRIRATRALARLGTGEAGREALIQLLLRDTGNARVRGEVLQALCDLSADVKGHRPSVEPLMVEPFFLDREGRVKKRA
jgi:HEAT repeat protein